MVYHTQDLCGKPPEGGQYPRSISGKGEVLPNSVSAEFKVGNLSQKSYYSVESGTQTEVCVPVSTPDVEGKSTLPGLVLWVCARVAERVVLLQVEENDREKSPSRISPVDPVPTPGDLEGSPLFTAGNSSRGIDLKAFEVFREEFFPSRPPTRTVHHVLQHMDYCADRSSALTFRIFSEKAEWVITKRTMSCEDLINVEVVLNSAQSDLREKSIRFSAFARLVPLTLPSEEGPVSTQLLDMANGHLTSKSTKGRNAAVFVD